MRVDKLQSSFPHSSLLLAGTVDNTKRKIPSPQTQGGFASLQTGNKATEVHLWHSAVHVSEWLVEDSAEGGERVRAWFYDLDRSSRALCRGIRAVLRCTTSQTC